MKRKIIYISGLIIALLSVSCSDFLDIKDESAINPGIWDNEESAKLYLNNIYGMFFTSFGGEDFTTSLANISDETTNMSSNLMIGAVNINQVDIYSSTYNIIRYVNIGFEALESSTLTGDARKRCYGQLAFFRAWSYWRLVRAYGGVPYLKKPVTFESPDEIRNAPRNKTSECITYIKEDLDSAINNLPAFWPVGEYSRLTRAAAAAFKGRVLLFYASPQFTPNNTDATIKTARWKDAYEANIKARDICISDGHGLMNVTVDSTAMWPVRRDMNQIFLTKKTDPKNNEVILVTPYFLNVKMHGYENSVCPGDLTGSRPGLTPSWDLVISFPMRDGSLPFQYSATSKDTRTFTGNGGVRGKFYLNRDARFYATIAYNGCYYPLEGGTSKRVWMFNFKRKNNTTFYGENTTVDKTTTTGFMNRKMVNPLLNRTDFGKSSTDWVELRFAEVLLNLAECAFEYEGNNSDVGIDCVKQIRERAGIDPGTDGSFGFNANIAAGFTPIEIVMNERRVEFAFEGKRFHDLRRRNMFTDDLGTKIFKLNGWKKGGSGLNFTAINVARDSVMLMTQSARDTIALENIYKYFNANPVTVAPAEPRLNYFCVTTSEELKNTSIGNFNFFNIPSTVIARSPAVLQSFGWQNGAFDPFE